MILGGTYVYFLVFTKNKYYCFIRVLNERKARSRSEHYTVFRGSLLFCLSRWPSSPISHHCSSHPPGSHPQLSLALVSFPPITLSLTHPPTSLKLHGHCRLPSPSCHSLARTSAKICQQVFPYLRRTSLFPVLHTLARG